MGKRLELQSRPAFGIALMPNGVLVIPYGYNKPAKRNLTGDLYRKDSLGSNFGIPFALSWELAVDQGSTSTADRN